MLLRLPVRLLSETFPEKIKQKIFRNVFQKMAFSSCVHSFLSLKIKNFYFGTHRQTLFIDIRKILYIINNACNHGSLRKLCFGSLIPLAGHSHPASISFSSLSNEKQQNGSFVSASAVDKVLPKSSMIWASVKNLVFFSSAFSSPRCLLKQ
jgi:hypothetical protein